MQCSVSDQKCVCQSEGPCAYVGFWFLIIQVMAIGVMELNNALEVFANQGLLHVMQGIRWGISCFLITLVQQLLPNLLQKPRSVQVKKITSSIFSDGDFCTGVEYCNPSNGQCISPGNPCPVGYTVSLAFVSFNYFSAIAIEQLVYATLTLPASLFIENLFNFSKRWAVLQWKWNLHIRNLYRRGYSLQWKSNS